MLPCTSANTYYKGKYFVTHSKHLADICRGMAAQMHHGNDLDQSVSDAINHRIREAVNEVNA